MKRIKDTGLALVAIVLLLLSGCADKVYETFTANSPVYLSYNDLRSAVKFSAARDLNNPGKIYFKDQFLLINEKFEGIHVFDVSNPSSPQNKGFIEIPGNIDLAIKGSTLYADSYIDLVSIDVSNFSQIRETGRVQKVFPYTLPAYDTNYPIAKIDQEKGVVVKWEIKSVKEELEHIYYPAYYDAAVSDGKNYTSGGIGGVSGSAFGIGGSMARFGLYENMLYVVGQSVLYSFRLKSPSEAELVNTGYINWNAETIYIEDKHMFLGTRNGMIVLSLETPLIPRQVGAYSHLTSCDPVVIKGDLAFVTLKGGTTCGGTLNQLEVIKMSNGYSKFDLLKTYPMTGPQGLGLDDEVLFVCDGDAGLKIYNAADPLNITQNQIAFFPGINAYDVIPTDNYLFMIGEDGFMLYDYSNIQNIKQIGFIPVIKTN